MTIRGGASRVLLAFLAGEWPSGYFHWQDGWFFARTDNGSVHLVKKGETVHDSQEAVIPPNEWASIIAHVAKGGEAENYAGATRLHVGASSVSPFLTRWTEPPMADQKPEPKG